MKHPMIGLIPLKKRPKSLPSFSLSPLCENTARRQPSASQEERALTRTQPSWHPDLRPPSLQNCERRDLCCLSGPVYGTLSLASQAKTSRLLALDHWPETPHLLPLSTSLALATPTVFQFFEQVKLNSNLRASVLNAVLLPRSSLPPSFSCQSDLYRNDPHPGRPSQTTLADRGPQTLFSGLYV